MSFDGYLKAILSKFGDNSLKFSKDLPLEELILAVGSASIVLLDERKNYSDPFLDAILHDIDKMVILDEERYNNDEYKMTNNADVVTTIPHSNQPLINKEKRKIVRYKKKNCRINQAQYNIKNKQYIKLSSNKNANSINTKRVFYVSEMRLRLQGALNTIKELENQRRNLIFELNMTKDEVVNCQLKKLKKNVFSLQQEEVKYDDIFDQNIVDDVSDKLKKSLDVRCKLEYQLLEEKKKCKRSKEIIAHIQQLYKAVKSKLDNVEETYNNLLRKEESHVIFFRRRNKDYKKILEENESLKLENRRKQNIIDSLTRSDEIVSDEFIFENL